MTMTPFSYISSWYKVLILFIVLLASIVAVANFEPGVRAPFNRTVGPIRVFALTKQIGLSNVAICRCSSDKDIKFMLDNGLNISASLYRSAIPDVKGVILIVHGNTPLGRQLGLYRIVASNLKEKGYITLTLDLPGFGESDNPFDFEMTGMVDDVEIISSAIRFLVNSEAVQNQKFSIIGHSRGTFTALKAGTIINEIDTIIVIGPASRWHERLADHEEKMYFWRRMRRTHEFIYGTPIPDWYTIGMWTQQMENIGLENYVDYFRSKDHKPLMFLEGEMEAESDKRYREEYFSDLTEPKKFIRLKRANHYFNTARMFWLNFYDRDVMIELVNAIDKWSDR